MIHPSIDLLKRINLLVKQNQDLISENEKFRKRIEELSRENEQQKVLLEKLDPDKPVSGKLFIKKPTSLRFDMATILYVSIHGFTNIKESMNTQSVMDELDLILFEFDSILDKYHIQKIKTIGDSYMAAGGIPVKNMTNPIQVVQAAIEMLDFVNSFPAKMGRKEKIWEIKLGIHTGSVVAAESGRKKITYDLKGDTVNIASRMEAYSRDGIIIISVMTFELIKELFDCEYFGKMPVKYKGDIEMYAVKGLKPEFSETGNDRTPNKSFDTRYKMVQFTDLQENILEKLENELPSYLFYHNIKHTVDVVTEVELIGWAEGLSDEEILLLKTAGLFHDLGLVKSYDNHEYHGTVMARKLLPKYGYSEEQIEIICETIMATKLPPRPNGILQEIICDSDLDYLGRSDMIPVSNTLYKELKEQDKISSLNEWNKLQIKFISNHQYFTKTARSLREVNKQLQIERLKSVIRED